MFKRNFLSQVLLRVDFSRPIALPPEVLGKLKVRFEPTGFEAHEQPIQRLEFSLTSKETKVSVAGTVASYTAGKKKFQLQTMENTTFILEVNDYSDSKSFIELFTSGLNTIREVLGLDEFKRVGWRYINKISNTSLGIDVLGWPKYINTPYSIPYDVLMPEKTFSLRRSMLASVISDGEFSLGLNTGVFNPNFPSKITDHEFIVDIDCHISGLLLSGDDILKRLQRMNDLCYNYFRKVITPEFEAKLQA